MRLLVVALAGILFAAGCGGPNCQDSCYRFYAPAPTLSAGEDGEPRCGDDFETCGGCGTATSSVGVSWERRYERCVSACEGALARVGELGSYDPDERHTTGETIQMTNERQAAAWMDCVDGRVCDDLGRGYCPPPGG